MEAMGNSFFWTVSGLFQKASGEGDAFLSTFRSEYEAPCAFGIDDGYPTKI